MPREAIDWSRLDQKLRHFSRCGIPIRRQALRLGLAQITIKKRRAELGLVKKRAEKERHNG